jgi:hypothetical protein
LIALVISMLARSLSVLATRTPLRITLFLLLAWLCALPIIAQASGMNTFHDAQFLSAYERHARLAVLQFGQLPLWDPYSCGGMYGLAAPQTRYASPFFLFSLLLGVDRAASLFAVLWPALAMEGMFRYARSWGSGPHAALLCAPLFPLSGFFATSWYVGWVQFFSFCGLPFILLGLRGALRGSRASAYLCGVSCLVTVGFGGTWTLPMGAPLCLFELCDALLCSRAEWNRGAPGDKRRVWLNQLKRRARVALPGLLLSGLLVLCIGAVRLWPMLESAPATLRTLGGEPAPAFRDLAKQLFVLSPPRGVHHDTGAYYVAPLVLLSLLALPFWRATMLWPALFAFVWLALGHVTPHAPFALLRKLPVYDTMRYPERFLVELTIVWSLLTARALSVALAQLRRRFGKRSHGRALFAATILLALGWASEIYNIGQVSRDVEREPTPVAHVASFRQSRGNRWLMSHFAGEGMGSLACGEAYPVPMSRHLRGDLEHEEYVLPDGLGDLPGSVQRLAWSPNALTLRVHAKRPLRVAINQNYHPGWTAEGGQVESWDSLLSVRVPAGDTRVVLRFRPRSGIGGAWVTLVSLCAGALWLFGQRRGRGSPRRSVLLLALGPCLWLTLLLVWHEPALSAPIPTTPDGSPVYPGALPIDATPMHIRFDTPITLEGARLSPVTRLDGKRQIDIDLFMRREGALSPNLGVFVFLRSKGKRAEHGDHSIVSGVVYLPRLRLGALARDAFRLAIPERSIGTWEVRVGFWNAHGDGARHKVTSHRGARVIENAIVIGAFEVLE